MKVYSEGPEKGTIFSFLIFDQKTILSDIKLNF